MTNVTDIAHKVLFIKMILLLINSHLRCYPDRRKLNPNPITASENFPGPGMVENDLVLPVL
jgi:hypothetical protein